MWRTIHRNSARSRPLGGIENLEDRRLLTANAWHDHASLSLPAYEEDHQHDVHEQGDHGHTHHEHRGIPLDESDWSISTVSSRGGTLSQSEIFNLQSKPDSDFTIYLDFDGHVTTGTIWNDSYGIDPIVSPAFDLDGNAAAFSQMELQRILVSWQRTAEDFAGFDVNVTTRDPGVDALVNSGFGDTTWGARAVATFDTFANCGCGGHAFLNTFDDNVDTPTFVYNLGEGSLGETFSHEVGHMLGLVHDGNSGQTYYPGHGSGDTQWGAIMGAPFDENVTQWDRGEYFDANNGEDDLLVITTQNGFSYRNDDYEDSIGMASALGVSGGNSLHAYGIIETNTDRDYFSFETGGGNVSFDFDPLGTRPNLDIFAALYDSGGNLVTFDNPLNQLSASINANVSAGTYFIRVEGVGSDAVFNTGSDVVSDPAVKPWQSSTPTGYSDYGSIGQYTINGTIAPVGGDTFSLVATDAVLPEGTAGTTPFVFTVTRSATGTAASVDYSIVDTLPAFVGATSPDLATNSDFQGGTAFSGTLNFAANESSQTITLNVAGDTDFELDEYFDVQLSNPSAGWSVADSRATGIILSDESEFGIAAVGVDANVNEGPYDGALVRWRQVGAASGAFDEWAIDNVSLANSTLADDFDPINNANWSTISNGSVSSQFGGGSNALTMTGGTDRRIVTRLLNASPGDTLTFDIIFGDGTNGGENADPGEDVLLEFSLDGGSNWEGFAVFDTEDYTSWTTVQADLPTGIDTNPPSELTLTVVRDGGTSEAAAVDWVVDTVGVAEPVDGADFPGGVLPSGQVNFASGESTSLITIPINGDLDFEPDENLRVMLTGVSGTGTLTLDAAALIGLGTINNDDAGYNVNPGAQFRLRQLDNSGSDFDNWGIDNVNLVAGSVVDDFDPDIDLGQWNDVSLGVVNNNFGGSGNSLFFTGGGERSITTNPLSAQTSDVLSFDFIYGDDNNGGENPEGGEEVVLEYSIGGQNWVNMNTYNLNITSWTTMNEPVPAGAVRPPTAQPEGTTLSFDVQRFGIDTGAIESFVTWQVVGSGANPVDAMDFPGGVLPSGTINFAAGEVLKSVDIAVVDDGAFEADETFDFVLGATGGTSTATGTILNNDVAPSGDFNNDGSYDCADVDALVNSIVNQTNISTYDMNGDAALDLMDLDEWLTVAGSVNLASGNRYLDGDANLDGIVDGQDFLIWNNTKFTSGNGWCGGDFNADGVTDGQDFLIWNGEKFNSATVIAPPTFEAIDDTDLATPAAVPAVGRVPVLAVTAPPAAEREFAARQTDRTTVRRHDAAIVDWAFAETEEEQADELAVRWRQML